MVRGNLINIGNRMKIWLYGIIRKHYGEVSFAKGLYNIVILYLRYVPKEAIRKMRMSGGRRKPYKRKWT